MIKDKSCVGTVGLNHLKVMRTSGVRAGHGGSPNIYAGLLEELNDIQPTFRKLYYVSGVWISLF